MFYVLVLLVLLALVLLDMRKPRNFPKGPAWFPVIGSALRVAKSRQETGMLIKGIAKIAAEYPTEKNVVGFKVGKDKVVFSYSTESLLEMFMNPDLDGRPYGPFYETRTWNLRRGILLTDEGSWNTRRDSRLICQSISFPRLLANPASLRSTSSEGIRLCSQRNAGDLRE